MILSRRALAPLFLVATTAFGLAQQAGMKKPFSDAAFDAANKAGKAIFVEVHAPWCPTCKQQAPHISQNLADPKFKNITVFSVDFDSQKDALRKLGASRQSTLIAFKGGKETARSVGDTNGASIKTLMDTLL